MPLGFLDTECKAVAFTNFALNSIPFVGPFLDVKETAASESPSASSQVGALATTVASGAWVAGQLVPAQENQVIEAVRARPHHPGRLLMLERKRNQGLKPVNRFKVAGKLLGGLGFVLSAAGYYNAYQDCGCEK